MLCTHKGDPALLIPISLISLLPSIILCLDRCVSHFARHFVDRSFKTPLVVEPIAIPGAALPHHVFKIRPLLEAGTAHRLSRVARKARAHRGLCISHTAVDSVLGQVTSNFNPATLMVVHLAVDSNANNRHPVDRFGTAVLSSLVSDILPDQCCNSCISLAN
jgi:hypothetical protein